ncbi:hypothetical protein ABID62_009179 [Bradyrhizobium sp. S3.9.1]
MDGLSSSYEIHMVGGQKTIVKNGVYVANNAWNPGSLVDGVDYTIQSTSNLNNLTEGTTFQWSFPTVTDLYSPVRAYPDIIFGVAPYGDTVNATDTTHTFPMQLGNIAALTADYSTTYSGDTTGFNVSFDIWLTSAPNGDGSTVTNEIMIWTHGNAFQPWGDAIGKYSNGAYSGTFYHTGTYTALILDNDVPAGTFDINSVFDSLKSLNVVSDKEWLASVDFGSEVISGSGSLTINNLDLSLTTNDGTSKEISGKGTTTIVGESAHDLQPITDSLGVLTGYRETTSDSAGNQIVRMYDSERTLLTTESINTASNGNVFTEMRDANGNFQSLTGVIQNADGSTMTAHYSESHALTGWEISKIGSAGNVTTVYYSSTGSVTGSSIETTAADGTKTVVQYDAHGQAASNTPYQAITDANGTFTGYKLVSTDDVGDPLIKLFDFSKSLAFVDSIKHAPNGDVFISHSDAAGNALGVTGLIQKDDGSVLVAQYDAAHTLLNYHVDSTMHSGTDLLQLAQTNAAFLLAA